MTRATLSDLARTDIVEIGLSIYVHSVETAIRVTALIHEKAAYLAENPGTGRPRDDLAPGLRSSAVFDYIIVYHEITGGIEVLRVFHGARDISPNWNTET